jgi:acetyltransferase-like isoleucine patch superfamily enzyme
MVNVTNRHPTARIGEFNVITVSRLHMEERSEIHDFNKLIGTSEVFLGRGSVVSDYCLLMTSMHTPFGRMEDYAPYNECDMREGDIIIGPGAYIGPHSTICPGITVGEGAVVGAYCYVTKDVRPGTMIHYKSRMVSNERTIKKRIEEEELIW